MRCGGLTDMCNQCNTDPRDDLVYGVKTLKGLADLVSDIHMGGNGFERTQPGELGELLDIIRERIDSAATRLEGYVPRA